jgi:hypothetical protein
MLGFNGGRIGTTTAPGAGALSTSGLWLPSEQCTAKQRGAWPFGPNEVPGIGDSFAGGYFAGYISHTANSVATHALIVAPVSSGASGTGYTVTTNYQWKINGNITPNTLSLFDGRANTDSMITNGIASHPAAQFCVNLTIGGYTDWYLPASRELEIAYFNLKPTTTNNQTGFGINPNAVPARASNYTLSAPPRTSVAIFQSGNSQAFAASAHWGSTEQSPSPTTAAFTANFSDGTNAGNLSLKTESLRVRAFRRIAL